MSKSTCVKSENVKSKHVDVLDAFHLTAGGPATANILIGGLTFHYLTICRTSVSS